MTTTVEATAPMTTAETATTSATPATTSPTAATSTAQSQDSGAFMKQSQCWQGTRPVRANFCCEFETRLSCSLFWCKLDFPSSKTEVFSKISTLQFIYSEKAQK